MKKTALYSVLGSFCLLFLAFGYFQVNASSSYRGLIIDQLKFEYNNVNPGDILEGSFNVTHEFQDQKRVVTLNMLVRNFSSDGRTGNPMINNESMPFEGDLSKWVKFDKDQIVLDHYGQVEKVNFKIEVPQNAEPGGKYSMLLLSNRPKTEQDNSNPKIGIESEIGPLLILNVNGDVRSEINIDTFKMVVILGNSRKIFVNLPVNFVINISNKGNVHTKPIGMVIVYKGNDYKKFVAKFDLNEKGGYILPDSNREFVSVWGDGFMRQFVEEIEGKKGKVKTEYNWSNLSKIRFGKYNVKVFYITSGEDNTSKTAENNYSFWVIPWQMLIVTSLIVLYSAISLKGFILNYSNQKTKKIKNNDKNVDMSK